MTKRAFDVEEIALPWKIRLPLGTLHFAPANLNMAGAVDRDSDRPAGSERCLVLDHSQPVPAGDHRPVVRAAAAEADSSLTDLKREVQVYSRTSYPFYLQ